MKSPVVEPMSCGEYGNLLRARPRLVWKKVVALVTVGILGGTMGHAAISHSGLVSTDSQGNSPIVDWDAVGATSNVYIAPAQATGDASVTVDGGTSKTINVLQVTYDRSFSGSITVTGQDSYFRTTSTMWIGNLHPGCATVRDGGALHSDGVVYLGIEASGSLLVDNGAFSTDSEMTINRFSSANNSDLTIVNGGSVLVEDRLALGSTSGVIEIGDGSLRAKYLGVFGDDLTVNVGASGILALDDSSGSDGMSEFMGVNTNSHKLLVNIWDGDSYEPYGNLTEGVDYQVQPGAGDFAGYGTLTSLHAVPEPTVFSGLLAGVVSLLSARRWGQAPYPSSADAGGRPAYGTARQPDGPGARHLALSTDGSPLPEPAGSLLLDRSPAGVRCQPHQATGQIAEAVLG